MENTINSVVGNGCAMHHCLYRAGDPSMAVYVVEDKESADCIGKLGYCAVCGEDSAGHGKWRSEYTEELRGCAVCIVQGNSTTSKLYAQEVAAALYGAAASVAVVTLSAAWPEIPIHGSVLDLIDYWGVDTARSMLVSLTAQATKWVPPTCKASYYGVVPLSRINDEEVEWLVPQWMPSGCITLLAGDGGVGKSSVWANLAAAISSGQSSILDPEGFLRTPGTVLVMTAEESLSKVVKRRLREAGADLDMIQVLNLDDPENGKQASKVKLGSDALTAIVRDCRPILCVIDPLQSFVPQGAKMVARSEMRECMESLVRLGAENGTAFLVVCHTNKRAASGRDKISESSDLWDISRAVWMVGEAMYDTRYISNEKNSYASLSDTVLFGIDDGQVYYKGRTQMRDEELRRLQSGKVSQVTEREQCKSLIIERLRAAGGSMQSAVLQDEIMGLGTSETTYQRARKELRKDQIISIQSKVYDPTDGSYHTLTHLERTE